MKNTIYITRIRVSITISLFALFLSYTDLQAQHITLNSYSNQTEIKAAGSVTLSDGFHIPAGKTTRIYIGASFQECVPFSGSPSKNQNYVATRIFKIPGVTSSNIDDFRTVCDVNQTIQYFDGLGRPLQIVNTQASPTFKDVVQPMAYDVSGREEFKYLPYTTMSGGNGSFKSAALTEQATFYNSPPSGVASIPGTAFTKTHFEDSPLSRLLEQGAPGPIWQPVPNSIAGHTQKNEYAANTEVDSVKFWVVNATGANAGYYLESELYKTISKDENWQPSDGNAGTSEEFKDFEGRVVLKRIWETNGKSLSTYYIYDDFGSLRYVLPPAVNENGLNIHSFTEFDEVFNNYIYGYRYDDRKRVIERKISGVKFWERLIYNKLDQLVLSQDANQRDNEEWLFNKYDVFGRLVVTGLYKDAADRETLQTTVNSQATLWESRVNTGEGYDNASFPQTMVHYHNVNYYDDYSFPTNSFGTPTNTSQVSPPFTKGLLTGVMVKNLGSGGMLLTVKYYDEDGRVVQTKSQNHLNGQDIVDNTYNFAGQLTGVTRTHIVNGIHTKIANTYEYDHLGRKLVTKESINEQPEIILSRLEYNEIAQLKTKNLHSADQGHSFIQKINYRYNERGWLKEINNPNTIDKNMVFGMTLNYASKADTYNGNIASINWQTLVPTGANLWQSLQTYTYAYDRLNRLKKATYYAENAANKFNEEISYDLMGNIINLKRKNNTSDIYVNDFSYDYTQNNMTGNRLWAVTDQGTAGQSSNFTYDNNGNQKTNSRIGISSIDYNYLNLPKSITKQSTGETLNYVYDAGGSKLRKQLGNQTVDYLAGIQYSGNTIDFIETEEGRAIPGAPYTYEYFLKDHLNNTRAVIKQDGSIVQIQDYYAFGLEMNPGNSLSTSPQNNYKYNGKEKQIELGLEQLDYKARFYDPLIGRFGGIDKLASSYPYKSPYDYAENKPVNGIDFDGLEWVATYNTQGNIHINANLNFSFDIASMLPKNVTITDYQSAINKGFNDMFMQSSGGKITGSVTYNGGDERALGQVVPSLLIYAGTPSTNGKHEVGGQTSNQYAGVNIYNVDGSIKSPKQVAWDAVHELTHTLRVGHPFETTQGKDTKLVHEGGRNYSTTVDTDPGIYYNVMNYGMITINGQKLSDLWQKRDTRTLTPDQIKFILNEINLQGQGYGSMYGAMKAEFEKYWYNQPGSNVPIK